MRPLLAAVLAVFLPTSAFAAVPQSQRDALIAVYNATNGAKWTNNTNWLGPAGTECTWYDVQCDDKETTVIELTLIANNLQGTIPAAISGLSDLQELLIYDNVLTGTIPASIGQLTK